MHRYIWTGKAGLSEGTPGVLATAYLLSTLPASHLWHILKGQNAQNQQTQLDYLQKKIPKNTPNTFCFVCALKLQ